MSTKAPRLELPIPPKPKDFDEIAYHAKFKAEMEAEEIRHQKCLKRIRLESILGVILIWAIILLGTISLN